MAVAFDNVAVGSGSGGNLNIAITPAGTPRGVLLMFSADAAPTGAITYGGETMGAVALSGLAGSGDRSIFGYLLGAGVPTGEQTATAEGVTTARGMVVTLTADDDTEVVDTTTISTTANGDITGTLSHGGRSAFDAECWISSAGSLATTSPLTGWTERSETDEGNTTNGRYTYDTVDTADVTFGVNTSVEQTLAILGVAIAEVEAGGAVVGAGLTSGLKLERRRIVA